MARKPIEVETRALLTPRERIWRAICSIPKGASFSRDDVQDRCVPMVRMTAVVDYLKALDKGGYITRSHVPQPETETRYQPARWTLTRTAGEAPRLDKKGQPVTQGLGTLAMWRAMKVLKAFDYVAIAQAASLAPLVVEPQAAKAYVNVLARAGYLQVVKASKPGKPAQYRLKNNTGPHAPAITRRKCVFDRNTGTFAELESDQEVCDAAE